MSKIDTKRLEKLGYKIYENDDLDFDPELDPQWWEKDNQAHKYLFNFANRLHQDSSSRRTTNEIHWKYYTNRDNIKMDSENGSFTLPRSPGKLTLNVVKNCVDSVCNKISKNKTEIRFITDGADYNLQEKARLATKYIEGIFHQSKVYELAQSAFRDSTISDVGAIKIYFDEEIKFERILPNEILVDEKDAFYGMPEQVIILKKYPVRQLLKRFPAYTTEIKAAMSNNMVKVVEAWRLNEKHCLAIDGATLLIEDYNKDYFPLVFFRWTDDSTGIYGISLAEELLPIQKQLNRTLKQISKGLDGAVPRAFFNAGSNIDKEQFSDEIWSAVVYHGQPPIFSPTSAFPGEVYSFLWQLLQQAYQIAGVSQLSAAGMKPAGVDAAVALRELQDIESQRFALPAQRWEEAFTQIAKIVIDISQEQANSNNKFDIKVIDDGKMRTINWLKDINLDKNKFLLDRKSVV